SATVLVIDDDPVVRDLLQRALNQAGYTVETAASGADGLRRAKELRPAAITLDVLMPGMDGWQVLTALKADPELAHIPVIMLTMLDDRELGYALGATAFLSKPVDREKLLALLKQYRGDQAAPEVLIVDDDATTRELLRRSLAGSHWQVIEAENGRIALERIAASAPARILLDLTMPELDGFEVVARLREHPDWRRIPVVVVTAKDLSPAERERLNGSVARVLQKGAYRREELLAEVRALLATHAPIAVSDIRKP
ncbi:MAG: response regulator, partial [Dehalococcoidia bacterium]